MLKSAIISKITYLNPVDSVEDFSDLTLFGVPQVSNPNAPLIVKAIGEGFGFLLWL